ncbi:MAG: class I SAM-dependent methyltransferase [Chloroflexi bacterium]|nr:class I SAM-dependent methyltransferase [Chloroflexota bacterium]MCL5026423.1 class I SAM-dependent methyltransferase [Chloroflexota bacterium]
MFIDVMRPTPVDKVLDVGGEDGRYLEGLYPYRANITVVDLRLEPLVALRQQFPEIATVQSNGCHLPFADDSFDIVFANSLLEHVVGIVDRRQLANEIMRVGRRFFVATPNYYFPFEPHYHVPLFQFLPRRLQQAIKHRIGLGWYPKGVWEEIALLTPGKMRRLFPGARLFVHGVLGLPQTLIACTLPPSAGIMSNEQE